MSRTSVILALARSLLAEDPAADGPPVDAATVESKVTLTWTAPASCPDASSVMQVIVARNPIEPVSAVVAVRALADGLVAEVEIVGVHGDTQRTLHSPACESIVDAVALLVQVAADPLPTPARIGIAPAHLVPPTEVEPAADELDPSADAADPLPRGVAPPPEVTPRPRNGPRVQAFVAAIVGGGLLPGLDAGGRIGVGIATKRVHAAVGALAFAPRTTDGPRETTATFDAFGGLARVCPVFPLRSSRVELSACAVVAAGAVRGRSRGGALLESTRDVRPWVRVAAGPELGVIVHPRLRLVAGVELGGHVARSGFEIRDAEGAQPVWVPRRWAAHGIAGIEVRLP